MKKQLPKSNKPLFDLPYPSKNTTVTSRPFLVKEEKILLIAGESQDEREITRAVKQVLANCVQDPSFDADDMTIFDLEMMFIKLRARSVNNIIDVSYRDLEDDKVYDFAINLDDVQLVKPETSNNRITIDENAGTGLIMKYPSVNILETAPTDLSPTEIVEYLIRNCIDQVYDEEDVYFASDYTEEELSDFLDHLEPAVFQKIREFFDDIPQMRYVIKYENSLGNKREIELTTLNDFFTWG